MATLTITRGLPGSGKTTWARAWVAEDPAHRARVNRDDLRVQLHAGAYAGDSTERQVSAAQHAAIEALLRRGVDVVCDDTNLRQRVARELRQIAVRAGAGFAVHDLTDVPLEVCLARDAARDIGRVGEDVILGMHRRYLAGKAFPLPFPDAPDGTDVPADRYVAPDGAPATVMVDIDGTVALIGARSPFDETRVHEDRPNEPVIAAVRAMAAAGHLVLFCSGRTDGCRAATEKWLADHVGIPYEALLMRRAGDSRQDAIVKREMFDGHIRHAYRVVMVFDDRDQVVRMWRSLGLTVFQVAPGNF